MGWAGCLLGGGEVAYPYLTAVLHLVHGDQMTHFYVLHACTDNVLVGLSVFAVFIVEFSQYPS